VPVGQRLSLSQLVRDSVSVWQRVCVADGDSDEHGRVVVDPLLVIVG
jgi:hypothetical protein